MRQGQEVHLARAGADIRQHNPRDFLRDAVRVGEGDRQHAACGQGAEDEDPEGVGEEVDEVGDGEFGRQAGDDAGEQDGGLGDGWADQVEGGGQDDDVEDVVDEAWVAFS